MTTELIHADCMDAMQHIASGSVDMVCADVPYGTTKCSWDSVLDLGLMWSHLNRITKPSAAIVLFSAQPYTSVLVSSNIRHWRTEWIWEKGNATGFLNAKKQPLRAHENILVFYRVMPTYNPQFTDGHPRKTSRRKAVNSEVYGDAVTLTEYDSTRRYPRDVQFFSSDKQKSRYHPTQKPVGLVRYLVETYSNPGDVVLDFTMGSGTTGVACREVGRRFIGIEKELKYVEVARQRILGEHSQEVGRG